MKKTHVLLFIILIAVLIKLVSGFFVNYLWFQDLGYTRLFTTPIIAKLSIGIISFLIYFLIIFGMGSIGFKTFLNAEKEGTIFQRKFPFPFFQNQTYPPEENNAATTIDKKAVKAIILTASILISFFLSLQAVDNGWMKLLEFINATKFGIAEDVFNKDISFYVFQIPFYNFVLNSLTASLTMILMASLVFFPLTGMIRIWGNPLKKGALHMPKSIRKFWAGLIGVLFILLALKKLLAMFSIMYAQTGYVYGAGYTDIHVTIPLSVTMAVLALLCAIFSFVYFFVNDHRLVLRPVAVYLLVAVLGTGIHTFVQYTVSNNEFVREKPYIEREIKFTRMAYNIDKLKVSDYPGTEKITLDTIKNNKATLENIRLNDPIPLKTVLSQNQGLRYYYRFHDIDIDRYQIDGKYRQVLLAPREMSGKALTEKAGTFVNLTMRYSHGYGLAATVANEIDESGYAKLIVKDIPPQSQVTGIDIKEPRIYFGELTNDEKYDYVIGNTTAKEFDYPQGDSNVENTYLGTTGLAFTPLNKLFLSAYFNTPRFYIAREIRPESKLLMRRNIVDRITALMPYLKYDSDPYVVAAADGKLYWILDAYSSTDKFPYSAPTGGLNYIRNSVKVVVDAYNGTVNFYVFDKNDPIVSTISKMFPGVFKDSQDMPSNLLEHIRYPEDYFKIQSQILINFHVSNPSVFYNREDTWDIAKKVDFEDTVNMEPYYTVMKLPGESEAEFTLMLPFTPASRQDQHRNNMVAWLAARNDGDHYGELVLYQMPKNIEIQGPLMIDSLIDQDPQISSKMTLWGQGGSQIIRGNLLVVPLDGGFIYVEPIYIKAEKQGASIPQMQAIVFAIDKKLVLAETKYLDKAVAQFFGQETISEEPDPQQPPSSQSETPDLRSTILNKIKILKQQLEELEKTVQSL